MGYIGNNLKNVLTEAKSVDTMVGDGSTTTIALSKTPGSVNNTTVFWDGLYKIPVTDYTLSGSTITFTTAPAQDVNVVVFSGNDSLVENPSVTVTSSMIADNTITDDKIVSGIDSEKLTGSLPASVDASALTGISAPPTIHKTTSITNPSRTENPSGGLGHIWVNKTSGEVFICTDTETDNNTWKNAGEGSQNIIGVKPFGGLGGGTISGYTSGGYYGGTKKTIDKFAFSSNAIATYVGDITVTGRYNMAGCSSADFGYNAGGGTGSMYNIIEKFSFSNDGNGTDVGDLSDSHFGAAGQSSSTHGYTSGGYNGASTTIGTVDRFSFSNDGNATNVANLNIARNFITGQSSGTHGYTSGGELSIEKFSFASDNSVALGGDLTVAPTYTSGQSSGTHGYISGGHSGTDSINKFSFSTDGNASFVGNMVVSRYGVTGQSSETHGYISAGNNGGQINTIEEFSFSQDGNAIDYADLSIQREQATGQQV